MNSSLNPEDAVPSACDLAIEGDVTSSESLSATEDKAVNEPIPFGKYYLLESINVGGMAEVFRAKYFGVEGFERLVAVKRILPNIAADREFISMFVNEAKISVMLNHANIAQVFDLGNENGAYYIALEHVHGRDLRAVFERTRAHGEMMSVAQACFVMMKVCEGLDYAHNKQDDTGRELKLVHRDVSPQNILVSFDGEIKITDFGIAKATGRHSQTQAGILKGKFGYMSPEQVRGVPVDRRSDIFACGIVLYEILTGERLFVGDSDFSTLEKVRNAEILPPSSYGKKIEPELERIVLKALAKDVEQRYQSVYDLCEELQAFVLSSGQRYSRHELARWMREAWAEEIVQESAKLARYRTMAMPTEAEALTHVPPTQRFPRNLRMDKKTVPPPIPIDNVTVRSKSHSSGVHLASDVHLALMEGDRQKDENGLAWDDDELETSIYERQMFAAEAKATQKEVVEGAAAGDNIPLKAPALTASVLARGVAVQPQTSDELDLSALLPSDDVWDVPSLAETSNVGSEGHALLASDANSPHEIEVKEESLATVVASGDGTPSEDDLDDVQPFVRAATNYTRATRRSTIFSYLAVVGGLGAAGLVLGLLIEPEGDPVVATKTVAKNSEIMKEASLSLNVEKKQGAGSYELYTPITTDGAGDGWFPVDSDVSTLGIVDVGQMGSLQVRVKPPCSIYVNGEDTGLWTPQDHIELPVGEHTVTFKNPGAGIDESVRITVNVNTATEFIKDFTK